MGARAGRKAGTDRGQVLSRAGNRMTAVSGTGPAFGGSHRSIRPEKEVDMGIDVGQAIRGALAGWAGMTGLIAVGRRAGLTRMDVMEMEGSLFADPDSTKAEVIGFFTHLGMSLWIGFAYALGFKLTGLRPSPRTGALGGMVHWLIATLVTGVASKKHPKREQLDMPGFGGTALGPRSAIGFLVGHLVYGTLFGWRYGDADGE